MTGPGPAASPGQPARDDLTSRLFRALYQGFDLHSADGVYVAVPKGVPCFAGTSLGDIARQICASERPGQDGQSAAEGDCPAGQS